MPRNNHVALIKHTKAAKINVTIKAKYFRVLQASFKLGQRRSELILPSNESQFLSTADKAKLNTTDHSKMNSGD